MGNNWLNLMNLKGFNIDIDSIPFDKQKQIFNELVEERSSEFKDLEKRNNPDNLLYTYRNEEISPKDFRNYQYSIELFKYLRDGNINPKEVLKDQVNFKSDLVKIKQGNKNENQKIK